MNDRYGWDDRDEHERWRGQSEGSHRSQHGDDYRGLVRRSSEDDDWRSRSGRSDFDREQRSGGSGTFGYGEGRQGNHGAYGQGQGRQGSYGGAQQTYASQSGQRPRQYTSSDYGYGSGQAGDGSPQPYYTGQQQGFEVPSAYGAPGTFGSSYGARTGGYGGGAGGSMGYGEDYREHSYAGRQNERGFLQKAGDEVASWFGDEDAARRREQDHRGRGPADYTRSDERIREDANDRLTEDWRVDASRISVTVQSGEVTLNGTVSRRPEQPARRAGHRVERRQFDQQRLRTGRPEQQLQRYGHRRRDQGESQHCSHLSGNSSDYKRAPPVRQGPFSCGQ
jgi:hypothetical protein